MSLLITKSDGSKEPFDVLKFTDSLKRAGAGAAVAKTIARDIEREAWSNISTQEIYARAFTRLREHKRAAASRYSLKRSIMEFGPSGFPFEVYIAELFRAEGFAVEVDQIIKGGCVEHEVDVVIHKKGEIVYGEAKFHNTVGFRTDLKTVLYIQARILDLRDAQKAKKGDEKRLISGLVVTNTKFTDMALRYAQCQGLALLGWDTPAGSTLHERIIAHSLYPVTVLTTLTAREKMALLSKKIVLCNTLRAQGHYLREIGVHGERHTQVFEEIGALCIPGKDIL